MSARWARSKFDRIAAHLIRAERTRSSVGVTPPFLAFLAFLGAIFSTSVASAHQHEFSIYFDSEIAVRREINKIILLLL